MSMALHYQFHSVPKEVLNQVQDDGCFKKPLRVYLRLLNGIIIKTVSAPELPFIPLPSVVLTKVRGIRCEAPGQDLYVDGVLLSISYFNPRGPESSSGRRVFLKDRYEYPTAFRTNFSDGSYQQIKDFKETAIDHLLIIDWSCS